MTNLVSVYKVVFLGVVVLLCSSCSHRSLYEAIHENRLQACEELPIPQQAQCKSEYDTEYEDYQRERAQLGTE